MMYRRIRVLMTLIRAASPPFLAAALCLIACADARAQDWNNDVDFVTHAAYQATHTDGAAAYAGGFPIKLRGVVLNDNEDWLDPSGAYDPGVHLWQLGGQAEIYVQAIDLPGDIGAEKTEDGYTIKIVEYHPDFKMGREPSPDDPPLNPAVKLDVSGPCGEKTLYSFSLVEFHGNRCDDGTEVVFHQPTGKSTLLLVSDGKGELQAWQEAGRQPDLLGSRTPLEIGDGPLRVSLSEFFAGSRIEKKIVPDASRKGPPAFQIRIGQKGVPAWINADSGKALSADGRVRASIGATLPLGFELTLDDAVAEYWPASGIPKAYYSFVTIKDHSSATAQKARIETNAPLLRNRFRLYQSGMDQQPPYRYSIFAVAFDPGLPFVTIGFLIMVAGLLWLYTNRFVRAPLRRRRLTEEVAS